MNMDPRSANINTEMGAVIESPGLAAELRSIMLRDMRRDNAWHVTLDEEGELLWTNSDETVDKQPSRGFMNRVMNSILRIVPVEQN
jgi:putative cardiolipin synthase